MPTDKDPSREVATPDIHLDPSRPGIPSPNGPRNLVEALGVQPFSEAAGPETAWEAPDVYVLSLQTEQHTNPPIRFCLSEDGIRTLADELGKYLP